MDAIFICPQLSTMSPELTTPSTPLLSTSRPFTTTDDPSSDDDTSPSFCFNIKDIDFPRNSFSSLPGYPSDLSYRPLAVLSGHIGSVSCLALCGEFILSASQAKDIIVWQQPDLRQFTKFGCGDGSVKAVVALGNKVFTAHQDSRIRVWKVSRRTENVFKLVDSLPTIRDCLGKFMKQSNYVQTRRNHKRLWIEHADSISCLAVNNGLVYSGSWDKTLKVWRVCDLKCLESIKAHDDAINSLFACKGLVFSASADGKIKAWSQDGNSKLLNSKPKPESSHCLKGIMEGREGASMNSVVVSEDGKWVYGGASDGHLMGWEGLRNIDGEFVSWRLVCESKGHDMAVLCVCLKGDEFLCSGSADKSIGLWRREAFGKVYKIGAINGHEGPVKCLQASPVSVGDGFLLYSGGLDKSLRVWWVSKKQQQQQQEQEKKSGTKCITLC